MFNYFVFAELNNANKYENCVDKKKKKITVNHFGFYIF